jgi:hypothetical protein
VSRAGGSAGGVSRAGGSAGGGEAVTRAARAGLVAKGWLYATVGVLAVRLALGERGEDASQRGAMSSVATQPFGRALLTVLAVGLAGYAIWRLWQASSPPESSLPRWLVRAAMVVRAGLYAGFAVLAAAEVIGAAQREDEASVTATVLALPGGVLLVVGAGLVIVAVGVVQFREAWSAGFRAHLDLRRVGARRARLVVAVGRAGHAARGVVFLASGGFLVRAALRAEPDEGVGLDAALREVLDAPAGPWSLGAIAVGLVLYGGFCLVQARFARPHEVE